MYVIWTARMWTGVTYTTLEQAQKAKLILEKDNPDLQFIIMVPLGEIE